MQECELPCFSSHFLAPPPHFLYLSLSFSVSSGAHLNRFFSRPSLFVCSGDLLKRTCSSLSLLSDITIAAALCADGVDKADLLADDEVEPPDDGSYSPGARACVCVCCVCVCVCVSVSVSVCQ